jgi:large subunit ribosomal protein L25
VAEVYELNAQKRLISGKKVSNLRNQDLIPAVMYGGGRPESTLLQVPARALKDTLTKAGGTHIINLNIDGQVFTVLAREVQRDIIRRHIVHVDFFEVNKDTRVTAEVPLHYVGEAPAVTTAKGVLSIAMNLLTIEALATQIPEAINVDLSSLKKVNDHILIQDLKLPDGVVIKNVDPEETVARINGLSTGTDEDETSESVSAEPEVIKKGKIEDEDAE